MAARKSRRSPPRSRATDRRTPEPPGQPVGWSAFWALMQQNRAGWFGFLLSLLQLAIYGGMFLLMLSLVESGRAAELTQNSPESWLVVGLLLAGLLTTVTAMFLSLYGAIRGQPKALALVGLCLSFFTGATVTFFLLIGALNAAGG